MSLTVRETSPRGMTGTVLYQAATGPQNLYTRAL